MWVFQDRRRKYNVTWRRFIVTIVIVEKELVLHILSVCVCVSVALVI